MLDLLAATLDISAPIRNDAERRLEQLYANDAFPTSLSSIASHKSVILAHRQAALLCLKKLVSGTWSPSIEEYLGSATLSDATKEQVRQSVLSIATAGGEERKIVAAAGNVVSKIASVDFPEQWPNLLPTLLSLVSHADTTQLHGVLVVLGNLVEDGFDEEQFTGSATDLVQCIYSIAVNDRQNLSSRALAVSIFRACFDTMELVYLTDQAAVQQFMQIASDAWLPFFLGVLKLELPQMPTKEETAPGTPTETNWRGIIMLKIQVVKVSSMLCWREWFLKHRRHSTRFTICSRNCLRPARLSYSAQCGKNYRLTYYLTTLSILAMKSKCKAVWKMQTGCHTLSTFW